MGRPRLRGLQQRAGPAERATPRRCARRAVRGHQQFVGPRRLRRLGSRPCVHRHHSVPRLNRPRNASARVAPRSRRSVGSFLRRVPCRSLQPAASASRARHRRGASSGRRHRRGRPFSRGAKVRCNRCRRQPRSLSSRAWRPSSASYVPGVPIFGRGTLQSSMRDGCAWASAAPRPGRC